MSSILNIRSVILLKNHRECFPAALRVRPTRNDFDRRYSQVSYDDPLLWTTLHYVTVCPYFRIKQLISRQSVSDEIRWLRGIFIQQISTQFAESFVVTLDFTGSNDYFVEFHAINGYFGDPMQTCREPFYKLINQFSNTSITPIFNLALVLLQPWLCSSQRLTFFASVLAAGFFSSSSSELSSSELSSSDDSFFASAFLGSSFLTSCWNKSEETRTGIWKKNALKTCLNVLERRSSHREVQHNES